MLTTRLISRGSAITPIQAISIRAISIRAISVQIADMKPIPMARITIRTPGRGDVPDDEPRNRIRLQTGRQLLRAALT